MSKVLGLLFLAFLCVLADVYVVTFITKGLSARDDHMVLGSAVIGALLCLVNVYVGSHLLKEISNG